ncbi:MAG: decaprenyl-phosphate phosphoribosyltransferase [Polyangiales bacterium]
MVLAGILKTARPKQWVKNLFVLAPVVFAKDLFEGQVALRALLAFACFSMLAGAIYTINDIVDADDDRNHPTKKFRPIASGQVPVGTAKIAATVFILVSLAGAAWLDLRVAAAAAIYLLKDLAYSLRPFRFKQVAYLDVVLIAAGFVLRVVAGCYAVSTPLHPVSPSLYLLGCTAFLALFLGFGKRYHELRVNASKARDSLKAYTPGTLKITLWANALATVAIYLAWTRHPPLELEFAKEYLWTTTPLVLLAIGRFVRLLDSESGESPTDAMLKDVPFVLTLVAWTVLILTLIYRLRPT